VAVVLAVVAVWGWLHRGDTGDTAVRRYHIVLPEENQFLIRGPTIAMSPDGASIVYVGPSEDGTQLWIKHMDQLTAHPLSGTANAISPAFSPDGERVAFRTSGLLKVVSLGGEPPSTLSDSMMGSYYGIGWGRDGYLYLNGAANARQGIVRVPENGGPHEQVTVPDSNANELYHSAPTPLPNGKGVVFRVHRGTDGPESDIVAVLDLRTGRHQELVHGTFAWYAPTGYLVFARVDGVLLAAPFDQDELQLTGPAVPMFDGLRTKPFGFVDVALSSSGDLVYVSGTVSAEAPSPSGTPVWVDRSGQTTSVEPGWTFDVPLNWSLALSPDGTQLAIGILEQTADVWIKQLDAGPPRRLTFEGAPNVRVSWHPNGRFVTFVSRRGGGPELYQKRADGTRNAELLCDTTGLGPIWQGRWSPDGEWLLIRTGGGTVTERDVWIMRPGIDSAPTPLLRGRYNETNPSLSPDGRWMLYVSDESGQLEAYVTRFPDVDQGKWQVSTDGGTEAMWSHSGREIFYIDGGGQMVAAEVATSPVFEVRSRNVLFDPSSWRIDAQFSQYFDVSLDDQGFLMVRKVGGDDAPEVILVENFFEELKERVGNGNE
ncbi:TolB family protein, partial [Gemmatimonadota bacterium]